MGTARSYLFEIRSTAPMTQRADGSPSTKREPSMAWVPQFVRPSITFMLTNSGLPIAPSAMRSLAFSHPGVNRLWWLMTSLVPEASQASTMLLAAAVPIAIGFSQMTAFTPAFAAAIVSAGCMRCHAQTLTISGSSATSISSIVS